MYLFKNGIFFNRDFASLNLTVKFYFLLYRLAPILYRADIQWISDRLNKVNNEPINWIVICNFFYQLVSVTI